MYRICHVRNIAHSAVTVTGHQNSETFCHMLRILSIPWNVALPILLTSVMFWGILWFNGHDFTCWFFSLHTNHYLCCSLPRDSSLIFYLYLNILIQMIFCQAFHLIYFIDKNPKNLYFFIWQRKSSNFVGNLFWIWKTSIYNCVWFKLTSCKYFEIVFLISSYKLW